MSKDTDLVPFDGVREAEIVEDMPFIPDSRLPKIATAEIFSGQRRHKSEEMLRAERHRAKTEDALMIRERKIPVQTQSWPRKPLNPMVEFYNNLLEELALEVERSE